MTGEAFGNNTTGNYASGIQYRAFGGVKRMDYDMPDGDSQIKLEYDSRQRVSQSSATLAGSTTSFLLKADYSYLADGRLATKDDLLADAWDRSNEYDFAGRLTSNQFATVSGVRAYGQTIEYDAFSHMTQREVHYWNNQPTYAGGAQVNGRMTGTNAPTYDASGNIVYHSKSDHSKQWSTHDTAGRRIAVRDRWRMSAQGSQEDETGYEFDGDGRPVIEKGGSRAITSSNPDPMVVTKLKYQVWSTVLGSSLTVVKPNGNKIETKVFAGGTHIATQDADGGEQLIFHTADPVTGTVGKFTGGGEFTVKEESEPLGQQIELTDPGTGYPTTYGEVLGMGKDPEWQCLSWEKLRGGDFRSMPVHCQKKAALDPKFFDRYHATEREEDPKKVSKLTDSPLPRFDLPGGRSSSDLVLASRLAATSKKDDEEPKPVRKENIPDIGDLGTVQSEPYKDDPLDSLDASVSGGGGGGGRGIGRGPKAVFDQKKFDNCVKKLFNAVVTSESLVEGLPGKKDDTIWYGATIAGVAVALQTSLEKDSVTLGNELLEQRVGDGSPNSGATNDKSPFHNHIASDVYANLSPVFPGGTAAYTAIGFKALKIHELGNALAGARRQLAQGRNNPEYGIRDKLKNIGGYETENNKAGISDPDAGAALENCVFGGIVNLRTGQVGRVRGL